MPVGRDVSLAYEVTEWYYTNNPAENSCEFVLTVKNTDTIGGWFDIWITYFVKYDSDTWGSGLGPRPVFIDKGESYTFKYKDKKGTLDLEEGLPEYKITVTGIEQTVIKYHTVTKERTVTKYRAVTKYKYISAFEYLMQE
jgi:hypothetical protein